MKPRECSDELYNKCPNNVEKSIAELMKDEKYRQ